MENNSKKSNILSWRPRNFIQWLLFNICLIVVVGFFVLILLFGWLNIWTDHGKFIEIPQVKGLSYSSACNLLKAQGFVAELSDSIFDNVVPPGTVVEQNPKFGTKVKEGRTVYLTINAFSPKTVVIPSLTDVSLRQAKSILDGLGIKNVTVNYISSEYKDLVLNVRTNGVPLRPGMRLPVTASITLDVGTGIEEVQTDEEILDNDMESVSSEKLIGE